MRRVPPRRTGMFSTAGLAGWLFADLLLVLVLVGFSEMPAPTPPPRGLGPSPSASPVPTGPSSSPTPTPSSSGLSQTPVVIQLDVSATGLMGEFQTKTVQGPDADAVLQQVNGQLAGAHDTTLRAGMVLAFGGGSVGEINTAQNIANQVCNILIARQPNFQNSVQRDEWNGGFPFGHVEVDVYFFNT